MQEELTILADRLILALLPTLMACVVILPPQPPSIWAQGGTLPGPDYLGTLGGPEDLVVTDLNGDEFPDLLLAGTRSGILVIHEGQGQGEFSISQPLTVPGRPFRVAAADLDRDLMTDLLWIDEETGTLHWIYATGDPDSPYAGGGVHLEGEETSGLVITDLDQNGWPDVIVSVGGGDQLAVHLNDGAGSPLVGQFTRVGDRPGPLLETLHPQTGLPRIVLTQQGGLSQNIAVFDGLPLLLQQELETGRPLSLDTFYWDDDIYTDLLVVAQDGTRLQIHGGQADGSYLPILDVPTEPGSVSAVELDRIGELRRVIVGEEGRHRLTLYEGLPDGALTARQSWFVGNGFRQVVASDLDGSGRREILVPIPEDDRIALLRQSGAGLLAYSSVVTGVLPLELRYTAPGAEHPARVAVLHGISPVIRIYEPSDNSLRQSLSVDSPVGLESLDWAYVDADGFPDLLAIREGDGLEFYLADGNQGFLAPRLIPAATELADFGHGDIDGDGYLDLALADAELSAVRVFYGDGAGNFAEGTPLETAVAPQVVVLADLDLDQKADLLMLDGTRFLNIYFNNNGSWSSPIRSVVAGEPREIHLGLITPDLYPDIVVTSSIGTGEYSSYISSQPRAYSLAALREPFETGFSRSRLADLSGDGGPDLALSPVTVEGVVLRQGIGDGSFDTQFPIIAASLVLGLDTGDVDGDDKDDIILLDGLSNCLHILLQSPGPLVPVAARLQAIRTPEGVLLVVEGSRSTRIHRERDGRVFEPLPVGQERWEVWDRSARIQGENYRLLDEGGQELDRASAAALPVEDTVLQLAPPAPNPGRESVQIRFRAPSGSKVALRIIDARGRVVRRLPVSDSSAGWYGANWRGVDDGGAAVARGRYHVDLRVDGRRLSRSLVWMGN